MVWLNSRGFFCFLLLLAAISIEMEMQAASIEAIQSIAKARETGFEAERLNTVRAVIEHNVDHAVRETLHEQLLMNSRKDEIKQAVNARLLLLFERIEGGHGGEVKVRFTATASALDTDFLNRNSTVLVEAVKGKTVLAEYTFTGGLLRNQKVMGEVSGKNASQRFEIPPGYSITAAVVG